MEIILDSNIVDSEEFWDCLFRVINESYRIDYVVNKGKNYFNCSSSRYDATKTLNRLNLQNIKTAHKDHICTCSDIAYEKSKIHKNFNKRKVEAADIKYVYSGRFELEIMEDYKKFLFSIGKKINLDFLHYFHSGNFNLDDLYSKDDYYLYGCEGTYCDIQFKNEYNKINNLVDEDAKKIILLLYENNHIKISDIKFKTESNIIIKNNSGFNDDHRGLNHTLIELPFEKKINLHKEFTLEDLIVSNSNLKSHKFDYWYELYTHCKIKKNEKNNSISVILNYDHGS